MWWLVLLPGGRWNGHCGVTLSCGRCYCHGSWSYFTFSSEVLSRTSSQMWVRWYLPIFLFRDGLLTLIYNASLIALLRFKGGKTIKSLLVAPKDQDPILKKSGVIYRYKCGRVDCNEEYIGESSRTFGERFKEHQKAPSPIFDHSNNTGHQVTIDNFNIVGEGGPEPQQSN